MNPVKGDLVNQRDDGPPERVRKFLIRQAIVLVAVAIVVIVILRITSH